MIWSILKILIFIAVVAGLTLMAGRLSDHDEALRIAIADTEFMLGPLQAVIAVLLLLGALWLLLKLVGLTLAVVRFLNGDETAISRFFTRNRERRGFQALVDGMMALASGEGAQARAKAAKAERLLRRPDLTNLMIAQAAEMDGDRDQAIAYYKRLLPDRKTRFVGLRGVLRQKLSQGDTGTALKIARQAVELKPQHGETQDTLLRLQADTQDWPGARSTLLQKKRHGGLPRDVYQRRDAVLALEEARRAFEAGNDEAAHEAALEANRLSPELVPAAAMAARAHIAANRPRKATKVIKRAWSAHPHPELAAAFAEIAPDETAEERLRRFATLTSIKPDNPETKMLLAELHVAAEDFRAARRALGDLIEMEPTARVMTIMAAIERGEGSEDAVVRGWLTRALTASRGPQWICESCHHIHSSWAAICANCAKMDTLSWRTPPEQEGASPTQTEMLPLIVRDKDTTSVDADPEDAQTPPRT